MTITCLCGQVCVTTLAQPDFLHECNCTICSKSGARWAYFDLAQVSVEGATVGYRRTDKIDPVVSLRFCATCGSTTHWSLTETAAARLGSTLMGVNMRLADEADLAGLELRYPDGRAWSGEGPFAYVRKPRWIGEDVLA